VARTPALCAAAAALFLVACAESTSARAPKGPLALEPEPPAPAAPEPEPASAVERAARGVVALVITGHDDVSICSGSLVAPNLVMTARHCVSKLVGELVDCDANGEPVGGAQLADDYEPRSISVHVGASVDTGSPDARQARGILTIHPAGQALCGADIAFVVLDRPLGGATVLPVRLGEPMELGSAVTTVGFSGAGASRSEQRRVTRSGMVTAVMPSEFWADAGTCPGDSGGPALDPVTGAVVGVVSRSSTRDLTSMFTRLDAHALLATSAFAAAGDRPILAPPGERRVCKAMSVGGERPLTLGPLADHGKVIPLTGGGFAPGSLVLLKVDEVQSNAGLADGAGALHVDLYAPDRDGSHVLEAWTEEKGRKPRQAGEVAFECVHGRL